MPISNPDDRRDVRPATNPLSDTPRIEMTENASPSVEDRRAVAAKPEEDPVDKRAREALEDTNNVASDRQASDDPCKQGDVQKAVEDLDGGPSERR